MNSGREQMEKASHHIPGGFNDCEHLLNSSSRPPSVQQPLPPAITTLTHITDDDSLSIFPPINHEDLPVYSSPPSSHLNRQGISPSALEASPCPQRSSLIKFSDSSHQHQSHSRLSSNFPLTRWSSLSLQTLTGEFVSLISSLATKISPFKSQPCSPSCGGTITVALLVAFGMWKWWQKRRRRPDVGALRADKFQQLNLLIRQKDEKITELLNQIAQLNRILIARYKVPMVNSTG